MVMEQVKKKVLKLKNKYNGKVVHTKNYDAVTVQNGINFIEAYDEVNPNRIYLINKDSFDFCR